MIMFMAFFTVAYIYMWTDSKEPFYFQQGRLVSKLHTSHFFYLKPYVMFQRAQSVK